MDADASEIAHACPEEGTGAAARRKRRKNRNSPNLLPLFSLLFKADEKKNPPMKKVGIIGLLVLVAFGGYPAELSPGLKALQGKWAGDRTNRDGDRYTFTIEINDDRLTFEAKDAGGDIRFLGKGTAKVEKAGPLNILTVSNIRAGRSADDLQEVDETRTSVYAIRDEQLLIASNFDRERENERPRVDEYRRVAATAKASDPSSANLAGTWNLDMALADQNFDYKLRIDKEGDAWKTTFISPRSGEHKAKTTTLKGNDVEIVIDRQIEGNNTTFVYKGKLAENKISGTVTVKGFEDQFTGTWTATR